MGSSRVLFARTRLIIGWLFDHARSTARRRQSWLLGLEDRVNSHGGRIFSGAALSTLLGHAEELECTADANRAAGISTADHREQDLILRPYAQGQEPEPTP
jgi:hypothetical protein